MRHSAGNYVRVFGPSSCLQSLAEVFPSRLIDLSPPQKYKFLLHIVHSFLVALRSSVVRERHQLPDWRSKVTPRS